MRRRAAALLCLLGCGATPSPAAAAAAAADWRRVATPADRMRMRRWRDAWNMALARAGVAMAAEGALLAIDGAMPGAVPPAGDYRCRLLRMGGVTPGTADPRDFPWGPCRITAETPGAMRLAQLHGPQRHAGIIYDADGLRAAFLGTVTLGDETRPFRYGRDAARDAAGWVERVGPARWRLALPYPAFGATLDVLELVPVE